MVDDVEDERAARANELAARFLLHYVRRDLPAMVSTVREGGADSLMFAMGMGSIISTFAEQTLGPKFLEDWLDEVADSATDPDGPG